MDVVDQTGTLPDAVSRLATEGGSPVARGAGDNPAVAEVVPDLEPEGDRLAQLYARHAPGALRFAYAVSGDRGRAEDAVQEAFVRVAGRRSRLRDPHAFGAYLRRAIVNELRARARSEASDGRRAERQATLRPTSEPARPDQAAAAQGHDQVWVALQALPERQRVAVVCRYWLDLPERDTAQVLGCRPGTVKSLLSRGLATLRQDLGDLREEPSDGRAG